jgi:hypothetical protein
MVKIPVNILIVVVIILASIPSGKPMVAQLFFGISETKQSKTVAVRHYTGKDDYLLLVNTSDLSTTIVPEDSFRCRSVTRKTFDSIIANTEYGRALHDATNRDIPLQDAGITRTTSTLCGIDLTVDLCPSRHSLDRILFSRIINTFSAEEKPVPLAVAITGEWMKEHPDDLDWLKYNVKQQNLSITWINHSFHHRFDPKLPLRDNFLLEKGTDLCGEIINNEIAMIERSITPSVFFRFPGLVSDRAVFDSVVEYGLIPIGSDAWLAKGQIPAQGSIVLVHGNGNEIIGIEKFFELVVKQSPEIRTRHWLLFDLRESIVRKEDDR